jgi:hypothetical protein
MGDDAGDVALGNGWTTPDTSTAWIIAYRSVSGTATSTDVPTIHAGSCTLAIRTWWDSRMACHAYVAPSSVDAIDVPKPWLPDSASTFPRHCASHDRGIQQILH